MKSITIRGANTHNLKNIDVEIPKNALIVITGVSGSGKSSLAFDTLYAEGQRRYVESLSAYARQFLSVMEKPEVESIEGLSPAIAIDQKSASHNPRSTVGTVTEIYDYLRLLFARIGEAKCPTHGIPLKAESPHQIAAALMLLEENTKYILLAPLVSNRKGGQQPLLKQLAAQGFARVRINGEIKRIDAVEKLNPTQKHEIELVVDRFTIRPEIEQRLRESIETATQFSPIIKIIDSESPKNQHLFSTQHACPICNYAIAELEPRLFSFNSPVGYCERCQGLGSIETINPKKLIQNEHLSLEQEAIKGWGKQSARRFNILCELAKKHQFSTTTPFDELDARAKQYIFYGDQEGFAGIIPTLEGYYSQNPYMQEKFKELAEHTTCDACQGTRLNQAAQSVHIQNHTLPQLTMMGLTQSRDFFLNISLNPHHKKIAEKIIQEITSRLSFLIEVGLNYLTLHRSSNTLSGGESQRIRLASQIGSGLNNVLYVLDEPSIGLHQRDNERLLASLQKLKQLDNTVVVIEHDEDTMRQADQIIDIGPGAGVHGGKIMAQGTYEAISKNPKSLTGQYLSGAKKIIGTYPKKQSTNFLLLQGATANNLQNVDIQIPEGCLSVVSGVSGSGKSSLINRTFYPAFANQVNQQHLDCQPFEKIEGYTNLKRIINIDQSPIGRTPRSNSATYTGLFNDVRELFAGTKASKARGYKIGRFSFNVKGGRCEACTGDGVKKIEMLFMPDVYVDCDLCKGKRYNPETLEIQYKGKNIYEVLEMTIEQAQKFFENIPKIKRKLDCLTEVGLEYLKIGQRATTLSGGEAQRIKLAKELSRKDIGNTLYVLDEPTTGLHFEDIRKLLQIIFRLRDNHNTIIIIEHNLDVIASADWVVDLGPEGGQKGGEILFSGWLKEFKNAKHSHTHEFLLKHLAAQEKQSPKI